jgi:hypothetical protein
MAVFFVKLYSREQDKQSIIMRVNKEIGEDDMGG